MYKGKDMMGLVFGLLTVVGENTGSSSERRWVVRCECGVEKVVIGSSLRGGKSRSCGRCAHKSHGMSRTPTYNTWKGMVERCGDPNCKDWPRYGGKGITVCSEWLTFENFFADMGVRPEGTTLDRYPDPAGGYGPLNCRWATSEEQAFNRGTTNVVEFNGVVDSQAGWARRLGISPTCLRKRLKKWPLERALTEPKLQLIALEK